MTLGCITGHIDCGQLKAPSNGGVKVDGTTVGAGAVYYCNEGFTLSSEAHRTCQPNGKWSGPVPSCRSKCYDHVCFSITLRSSTLQV